ncbi:MAG: hypothetical protein ACI81P_003542 [Neolewinella sp.]|jgi:hypothetical protein
MSFQIIYEALVTLRCWQPAFLGDVLSVPLTVVDATAPETDFLTRYGLNPRQLRDYLNYDIRQFLDIQPTERGKETLQRCGWRYLPGTQGGSLVASTAVPPPAGTRLQLAVSIRDFRFSEKTDFDGPDANPAPADPDQETEQIRGLMFFLTNQVVAGGGDFSFPSVGIGLDETRFIPKYSRAFSLEKNSDGNEHIEVRDPLLGNLLLKTLDFSQTEPEQPSYFLELPHLPAGLYQLSGARITDQYCLIGLGGTPGLLGIIELGVPAAGPIDLYFKEKQP